MKYESTAAPVMKLITSQTGRRVIVILTIAAALAVFYRLASDSRAGQEFVSRVLPAERPLFKIAEDLAAEFKRINQVPLEVPARPEFSLYPALNPRARQSFDRTFSLSPDSSSSARIESLQKELVKVGPVLDFAKTAKRREDLDLYLRATISMIIAYDARRGIEFKDSSGRPVLLFLPINKSGLRAFQYTATGLEDKQYRHFCDDVEKLASPIFVEALPVILGRGFDTATLARLPEDQRGLLLDFAAIYIAEAYKGFRGNAGRKGQSYTEALVRNMIFLPYFAAGGMVLDFEHSDSFAADLRRRSIDQTWAARGTCRNFFRGIRSRFQRELSEAVISRYFSQNHPELYASIARSKEDMGENIFQSLALEFQQSGEFSDSKLAAYSEFIRLLSAEAAGISRAIEAEAGSKQPEAVIAP